MRPARAMHMAAPASECLLSRMQMALVAGLICFPVGGRALDPGSKTPQSFGAIGDGAADDTAALTALISSGGNIHIPRGIYRIASGGRSAGGVVANLSRSLVVTCDDGAVFVADDLDHDMIRIYAKGADSAAISVQW